MLCASSRSLSSMYVLMWTGPQSIRVAPNRARPGDIELLRSLPARRAAVVPSSNHIRRGRRVQVEGYGLAYRLAPPPANTWLRITDLFVFSEQAIKSFEV